VTENCRELEEEDEQGIHGKALYKKRL